MSNTKIFASAPGLAASNASRHTPRLRLATTCKHSLSCSAIPNMWLGRGVRKSPRSKAVASGKSKTAEHISAEEQQGGGGDDGRGHNGDGGGGGDDEGDDNVPSEAIVAKVEATSGPLPAEFKVALQLGTLTVADLKKWQFIKTLPIIGALASMFRGFRERLLGNPRFLLALCAEEVIGGTAKMVAEVEARGDKFSQELPFVASDMALELICDFLLVWLVSPTRSMVPPAQTKYSKLMSSMPGFFLQAGNFTVAQRAMNYVYRTVQFGAAGVVASAIGHQIVVISLKDDPKAQEDLAPVHKVAVGWGAFMAISSNLRYQLVNCFEERVLEAMVHNKTLNILLTFVVRFGNCYIGGQQWIWGARQVGLQ